MRQALREAGGDWDRIGQVRAAPGSIACFLEVHIEQGTRLERLDLPLAVVSTISGIVRQRVTFRGEAGHAGTMPMADRHDPLRAAAHFVLAVAGLPEHLAGLDPFATATVGALTVTPNSPNRYSRPGSGHHRSPLIRSRALAHLAQLQRATPQQQRPPRLRYCYHRACPRSGACDL